jgi:hypothetical protein
MKYTRYDLKKKKDNKTFILLIVLILVLAFLFGTIIFKIFIGNYSNGKDLKSETSIKKNSANEKAGDSAAGKNNNDIFKFIVIQGGIYQNKENAETEKNLLNSYGTPFAVTEDNKTRILIGIYNEEEGEKNIKVLNDQKIDNSKMVFIVNKDDMCDAEIAEIVSANIQILNKLSEKNVKGVQTEDLKKWCISLKGVENQSKNIAVLNELKSYINKMPKEISKEKASENYIYLYGILKKIGSKK